MGVLPICIEQPAISANFDSITHNRILQRFHGATTAAANAIGKLPNLQYIEPMEGYHGNIMSAITASAYRTKGIGGTYEVA
jgi:hypothetical protein